MSLFFGNDVSPNWVEGFSSGIVSFLKKKKTRGNRRCVRQHFFTTTTTNLGSRREFRVCGRKSWKSFLISHFSFLHFSHFSFFHFFIFSIFFIFQCLDFSFCNIKFVFYSFRSHCFSFVSVFFHFPFFSSFFPFTLSFSKKFLTCSMCFSVSSCFSILVVGPFCQRFYRFPLFFFNFPCAFNVCLIFLMLFNFLDFFHCFNRLFIFSSFLYMCFLVLVSFCFLSL